MRCSAWVLINRTNITFSISLHPIDRSIQTVCLIKPVKLWYTCHSFMWQKWLSTRFCNFRLLTIDSKLAHNLMLEKHKSKLTLTGASKTVNISIITKAVVMNKHNGTWRKVIKGTRRNWTTSKNEDMPLWVRFSLWSLWKIRRNIHTHLCITWNHRYLFSRCSGVPRHAKCAWLC